MKWTALQIGKKLQDFEKELTEAEEEIAKIAAELKQAKENREGTIGKLREFMRKINDPQEDLELMN